MMASKCLKVNINLLQLIYDLYYRLEIYIMLGSVQGLYTAGMSYSGMSGVSSVVSPLNSEPTKMIQSNLIDKPRFLETQSSKPIQYSNAITSKENPTGINQTPINGESEDGSSLNEQNNLNSDLARQEQQVQDVINQLKARDTEVRAHEMAHLAVAGSYARGGMSFTYQTGPDGRKYAVGGEVGIDTSAVSGDPEATLMKAMVIQRAALAPAEPSSQDMKVAQVAVQMMSEARAEISAQSADEQKLNGQDSEESVSVINDNNQNKTDVNQITPQDPTNQSGGIIEERQQFNLRMQLPLADSMYG